MSMILSVYSQKAFREVVLMDRGARQMQVLIQKDLFQISRDLVLNLEKEEENWVLKGGAYDIILRGQNVRCEKAVIRDGLGLDIHTRTADQFTILAFEQSRPFSVYRKYKLGDNQRLEIGRAETNHICYQSTDFVSTRHCFIEIKDGKARLTDTSKNGTYLNFRRVSGSPILRYGDSIRVFRLNMIYLGNMLAINDRDGLTVKFGSLTPQAIDAFAAEGAEGSAQPVEFHRAPRNFREINSEPVEIEAPPNPPDTQDIPLMMSVGPAMTMAIPMVLSSLMAVMASKMGGSSSGYFMYIGMITAVSSAIIGAVWAVANVRLTKKQRQERENRRFERYSEYLIRMKDQVQSEYEENGTILRNRYISADECCSLNESSPLLWNRNATHEDFMSYRLGIGDIPFQVPITIPKEKFTLINDSLAEKPRLIQESYKVLKNVPVLADIRKEHLVGIVGGANRKGAVQVAQDLIAQIVTANSYTDVKIAIVYDENNDTDRDTWNFMMWFPHVWSEDRKIRYIATNKDEMGDVYYALSQVFRGRMEDVQSKRDAVLKPQYILIVTDPKLIEESVISKYVFEDKADIGLSTILLAEFYKDLPNACECIVENDGRFHGIYHTTTGIEAGTPVNFDGTDDRKLRILSRALGKIKVSEAGEEGEIPNVLTFFDMYGISSPEEFHSEERWKKADMVSSMKALVGFKNSNAPCYLDIHEKYHGPHGLIAGTTGSGKSETLQTYILSLAANYSPDDIGFFIIDYKGGGMANLFEKLPHMIGAISNLSGSQVKRAMASIKSENRRRQRIFTEYGVNNINSYTSLFKSGDAAEPIPHLFIIIDEFAELKREEPDFMKELISVAQVGRSLGVHLILATQRPSGTVDENIWANSKFRLCLRVQDRQDSMDMLHRPDAAYLTQTGRCYLQVGNDEIFELFQSGWSGASYDKELGGHSLLIAQMLSATGKVDLAGNHAKLKQKEALKRRWISELIDDLESTQADLSEDILSPSFDFMGHAEFMDDFYRRVRAQHPDFEQNHYNNTRVADFISVYKELKNQVPGDQLPEELIRKAGRESRRLPEIKSRTQLEAVVDYLKDTAERAGYGKPKQLWLPVLPNFLYLEDMEAFTATVFNGEEWPEAPKRFRLSAVIGMGDDPENQAQMPVGVDFANGGHHVVCGTVATGKSTFLQTVVYSLCMTYTPAQLNVYCLDFSARMLSVFSGLKHVGGIMDENDTETDRISKFFTMIGKMIEERKKLFTGTNFEDYVNRNGWSIPAVLIVIDNYGSFHEKTGEQFEEIMMQLAKEGVGYGIFLLVSAAGFSMNELPSRLAENFRTGICLEMQDIYAYGDILHILRPDVVPESNVKGRGLISYGDKFIEFQTALAARSEGSPERNDLICEKVKELNEHYAGASARPIPCIPEKPVREDMTALEEYQTLLKDPVLLPAGYDAEYANLYSINLFRNFVFLVTGTKRSGKTVFMQNLMLTCLDRGDEVHIAEIGASDYEKMASEHSIQRASDGQGIYNLMKYLLETMQERVAVKKKCLNDKCSEEETFEAAYAFRRIDLFIADAGSFLREAYNKESMAFQSINVLEAICDKGRFYNIFLFAEVRDADQNELAGYQAFRSMKEYRSGIRFGGRMSDQSVFAFDNVKYQDQDKTTKPGIGIIPSDDKQARLEKLIIPMYRG
jgi:S-DNA-T family DNA segregation ATPase FtsK/SpoIIIE